jgi:hypothetical protein
MIAAERLIRSARDYELLAASCAGAQGSCAPARGVSNVSPPLRSSWRRSFCAKSRLLSMRSRCGRPS